MPRDLASRGYTGRACRGSFACCTVPPTRAVHQFLAQSFAATGQVSGLRQRASRGRERRARLGWGERFNRSPHRHGEPDHKGGFPPSVVGGLESPLCQRLHDVVGDAAFCDELERDTFRPSHHLDLNRLDNIQPRTPDRPAARSREHSPLSCPPRRRSATTRGEEGDRNASGRLLRQNPSSLAIISFMISDVPAPMVYRRRSRQ